MMMRGTTAFLILASVTVVAACGDRAARVESPEVRFERESAFRQACAARLLAQRAQNDLQLLEMASLGADPSDPAAEISRRATAAAVEYARAYERHAELRAGAYANLDSAVNHAETTADSTRFVQRAGSYSLRLPAEGTVEGNVLNSYQADLSSLLADVNHPCNWDFPF
jgi:hypothetical protein